MLAGTIEENISLIRNEAKQYRRYASIVGFMKGFFMTASLIALLPLMALMSLRMGNLFAPDPTYYGFIMIFLLYLTFFLLPFLLCMPVSLYFSLKRKNTARILVFRKFNNKPSGKALSAIISSGLSKYADTFTLADSSFNVPWYVRIPFIQGQLSLFHFRQIIINKQSRLNAFKYRIMQKVWLNINWLLSADKIFAVHSSDQFWQQTAAVLLASSDLIVFDVSMESTNIAWEMEQCVQHQLGNKIITICNSRNKAVVEQWMEKFKHSIETPIPLFFYREKGELTDQNGFDNCVVGKLAQSYRRSASQQPNEWQQITQPNAETTFKEKEISKPSISEAFFGKEPSARYAFKRTAKLFAFTVAVVLVVLFFFSPYIYPPYVAANSFLPGQAVAAYIQCSKIKVDSARLERLGRSIHRRWPNKAAKYAAKNALNHYEDECNASVFVLGKLADPSQYQLYRQLVTNAEPPIAAMAAHILGTMKDADGSILPFALQLMASANLDDRLNAIEILHALPLYAAIADTILAKAAVVPVSEKVSEHKASFADMRRHKSKDIPIDPQNEDYYYLGLFRLLSNSVEPRHKPLLQKMAIAPHLRQRIFAGLLLAQMNDARCVPVLIDALHIQQTKSVSILFFTWPVASFPYEQEIDSSMRQLSQPEYKPPIDSFLVRLNNSSGSYFSDSLSDKSHALLSLLMFVAQQYSVEESLKIFDKVPEDAPLQLANVLDSLYKLNNTDMQKRVVTFVRLQDQLLLKNLTYNNKTSERLTSAWLLARIGSAKIIKSVVEIANIYPLKDIFSSKKEYPHVTEAVNILELLAANLKTACNTDELIDLQKVARPELQAVLQRLMRKCKAG
ncbi:MAG: hypothetical protein ABJB11_11460 [Ferruginibacter sp.]